MRGRGIARGLAAQANRHDNFRNRPPNTSRPPSMHVDDFMKLEQKSEQTRPDLVVVDRQPHDSVCAMIMLLHHMLEKVSPVFMPR
ncbi:hypothetical protein DPMN_173208 [Dreissena polymorpha]|uniref:Uncharacterized protein n=1 Tax=Dreissena polymorpha TaxID=45954 RepID=A0A9D4E158_DREPO|nr:hypothetical protein DPMN_173208 [Dreissena polymorpha]